MLPFSFLYESCNISLFTLFSPISRVINTQGNGESTRPPSPAAPRTRPPNPHRPSPPPPVCSPDLRVWVLETTSLLNSRPHYRGWGNRATCSPGASSASKTPCPCCFDRETVTSLSLFCYQKSPDFAFLRNKLRTAMPLVTFTQTARRPLQFGSCSYGCR